MWTNARLVSKLWKKMVISNVSGKLALLNPLNCSRITGLDRMAMRHPFLIDDTVNIINPYLKPDRIMPLITFMHGNLTSLSLNMCGGALKHKLIIILSQLSSLRKFTIIESLFAPSCDYTPLSSLQQITHLKIDSRDRADHERHYYIIDGPMPNLLHLSLKGKIWETINPPPSYLPNITHLHTPIIHPFIGQFPHLIHLHIFYMIANQFDPILLPQLRSLQITHRNNAVSYIRTIRAPNLRTLVIPYIGDTDYNHLSQYVNIQELQLKRPGYFMDSVQFTPRIANWPIRKLTVGSHYYNYFAIIPQLKHLRHLVIEYCNIRQLTQIISEVKDMQILLIELPFIDYSPTLANTLRGLSHLQRFRCRHGWFTV
jgi:hypothetical protein